MRRLVVTLDGPVACGKSTLARNVANRVGYIYLSTGLLYRAVAYRVSDMGLQLLVDSDDAMGATARCQSYAFVIVDGESRLLINGDDLTDELRNDRYSMLASTISRHQAVRRALLDIQKAVGSDGGVVAEGRDTGRVVFPNADLKFWVTATPEFRAEMRRRDLKRAGQPAYYHDVYRAVVDRDKLDMGGDFPSLLRTSDMKEIDTTNKQLDDIADTVVNNIREFERKDGIYKE